MQARISVLESDVREMKRRPSAPPAGAGVAARIERVESRLAVIEEAFSPAFRTLPSRLDALEGTISSRVDQVVSAVGRMEVLSARLEESEEELGERLDILQARGEGLERRLKEATGAGGVAEWREEITSLRKEIGDRWAEESAAQPWRDELAALRDSLITRDVKSEGTAPPADRAELDALKKEIAALKASASADLEARVKALESMPAFSAESTLTTVKGIGPKYAKALKVAGVDSPGAIATLSDEDVVRIAEEVGASEKKVRAWRTAAKKM